MGIFDGVRERRSARQRRRSKRQSARQKRRQTRAEGRFDPEVVAARQARRGAMIDKFGTMAASVGAGMLGQGDALAAYTGSDDVGGFDPGPAYDDGGGGIDPMVLGIGAVAVVGILIFAMKK